MLQISPGGLFKAVLFAFVLGLVTGFCSARLTWGEGWSVVGSVGRGVRHVGDRLDQAAKARQQRAAAPEAEEEEHADREADVAR